MYGKNPVRAPQLGVPPNYSEKTKMTQTHLVPKEICEMLAIGISPVLNWIHTKQLKAVNVSNSPDRPRWRIARTDLDAFLESRSTQPAAKQTKKRPKPTREYV